MFEASMKSALSTKLVRTVISQAITSATLEMQGYLPSKWILKSLTEVEDFTFVFETSNIAQSTSEDCSVMLRMVLNSDASGTTIFCYFSADSGCEISLEEKLGERTMTILQTSLH